MNRLPQELVDWISSYLTLDDLKSTVLLSRNFQYAAEQYSEAFSNFTLTTENASAFLSTYSGRRFRYLRNVTFATSFFEPELDNNDFKRNCRDSAECLRFVDQDFTHQIRFLFSTLKAVETSLGNVNRPGKLHLTIYTPERDMNGERWCYHRTFNSWRVHLLSPSTLPTLASVQSFTIKSVGQGYYRDGPHVSLRKLDLRVLLDISSKFPNLGFLHCRIGGDEWLHNFKSQALRHITHDLPGPRRDSRHDFGKGFDVTAFPCLHHVQMDFLYPWTVVENIDQRLALPNLVEPLTYDPFSSSLRVLSYQLRSLNLRVIADETLFWPPDGSTPFWPNIERINIMFHMSTPSGSWYFGERSKVEVTNGFHVTDDSYPPLGPTEKDNQDDDETADLSWYSQRVVSFVRLVPIDDTLVPFLTAFAKAAAFMPSLKQFAIWSALQFPVPEPIINEQIGLIHSPSTLQGRLAWGIAYIQPGTHSFIEMPGKNISRNRQIWWRVGEWQPNPELHGLIQQIGHEKHGESLMEYRGYLGRQSWFEKW